MLKTNITCIRHFVLKLIFKELNNLILRSVSRFVPPSFTTLNLTGVPPPLIPIGGWGIDLLRCLAYIQTLGKCTIVSITMFHFESSTNFFGCCLKPNDLQLSNIFLTTSFRILSKCGKQMQSLQCLQDILLCSDVSPFYLLVVLKAMPNFENHGIRNYVKIAQLSR